MHKSEEGYSVPVKLLAFLSSNLGEQIPSKVKDSLVKESAELYVQGVKDGRSQAYQHVYQTMSDLYEPKG
jgi:hypothetical protein